jgi:hypothetical protein
MTKQNETQTTNTQNNDATDPIDAVELENVTGGCANCGCGQPAAAAGGGLSFAQRFAANFRR